MAFITGKTPQGNCGAVLYDGNGRYTCSPIPDLPGVDPRSVDLINFYAKITGQPGEKIQLDIQWPVFDEALCGWQKYKQETFFNVAHHCVFFSSDELNWDRCEDVVVDNENSRLQLELTLSGPVGYVSVNYYYTLAMYESLREDMASNLLATEIPIGHSRDGQTLRVFKVADPAVPTEKKRLVYYQGGQHCSEYGGMHLADAMLRYLCSGKPEAMELLQKYEFHILPVVSVADWSDGFKDELLADSNTVWDTLSTCETKAIDAYLRSLPQKPALLLDGHNARGSNFLIAANYVSPERVAQQHRFADLIAEYCDYGKKDSARFRDSEKYANFKQYALQNFGYSFTMEISRFWLYDRALQDVVPISRERFQRLGRQLPHAIDAFVSELKEW